MSVCMLVRESETTGTIVFKLGKLGTSRTGGPRCWWRDTLCRGRAADSVYSLTGQLDSMGWVRWNGAQAVGKMPSWVGRMASFKIKIKTHFIVQCIRDPW